MSPSTCAGVVTVIELAVFPVIVAIVPGSNPPVQLTKNPMVSVTFPSFSPNGKQIAYCAVAAGDDSGIWISDGDGSGNPVRINFTQQLRRRFRAAYFGVSMWQPQLSVRSVGVGP